MKQIKILYNSSKLNKQKRTVGYALNDDLNEAFKLLCKIKKVEFSYMIERMMESAIEDYLDEVEENEAIKDDKTN